MTKKGDVQKKKVKHIKLKRLAIWTFLQHKKGGVKPGAREV